MELAVKVDTEREAAFNGCKHQNRKFAMPDSPVGYVLAHLRMTERERDDGRKEIEQLKAKLEARN
jgi:hypothetical protein